MEEPGAFQRLLLRAFQLPKPDREVFLLGEIQGHSVSEIAEILSINVATAHARLQRARREIEEIGNAELGERAR
jgi:DNA-directed RNA polymerase specialized sigma24 family protein